jgi:3D (Asp-Asp-Asp) domain-containing protein
VGPLTRRWLWLGAALAIAVLSTGLAFTGGGAKAARAATTPALRAQADSLSRSESAALLQLYAAESSLARAQSELARLEERSAQLARAEQDARRLAEIVRRSLNASQDRVAALLRALYIQGEPDPIAVVFGATSLDEAMAGIEGLSRATALNEQLGLEAAQRAQQLARLRIRLAGQRESLWSARSAARLGTARLAEAVAGRRGTLAALRRRQSLTAQRLTALEARARAAQQRSADLTATSAQGATTSAQTAPDAATTAPGPPSPAPLPPSGGPRTLVVDAVAYHLPGSTASGLPVGVGVIAVDPTVIPLGTRLNVPGYGPAVAADVGSAVKGNIIDLWMPSTAQARAWGRRTVTITIYG